MHDGKWDDHRRPFFQYGKRMANPILCFRRMIQSPFFVPWLIINKRTLRKIILCKGKRNKRETMQGVQSTFYSHRGRKGRKSNGSKKKSSPCNNNYVMSVPVLSGKGDDLSLVAKYTHRLVFPHQLALSASTLVFILPSAFFSKWYHTSLWSGKQLEAICLNNYNFHTSETSCENVENNIHTSKTSCENVEMLRNTIRYSFIVGFLPIFMPTVWRIGFLVTEESMNHLLHGISFRRNTKTILFESFVFPSLAQCFVSHRYYATTWKYFR